MTTGAELPRDEKGRFFSARCPDPHCGGTLRRAGEHHWRCDGLTHVTETGPLFACPEAYFVVARREPRR